MYSMQDYCSQKITRHFESLEFDGRVSSSNESFLMLFTVIGVALVSLCALYHNLFKVQNR